MDLIMRISRLPKPGESLLGSHFMTAHGGKGANQAVGAARLGAQVSFVGCVGNDTFGALQRKAFEREGVSISHLKTSSTAPTGTAMILLTESGQNAIVVAPAANDDLLPADMHELGDLFARADVVISQLEIPLETVDAALCMARDAGVMSILDAGPARNVAPEILKQADIVSPNETEAETLTGVVVDSLDAARKAAAKIHAMGVPHVVMKLGERGCLYYGEEDVFAPAFEINALDATAAGDAFTAALGAAWGRMPLRDTLRFANAAGALAATVEGAQPSMPTLDAVNHFLHENG